MGALFRQVAEIAKLEQRDPKRVERSVFVALENLTDAFGSLHADFGGLKELFATLKLGVFAGLERGVGEFFDLEFKEIGAFLAVGFALRERLLFFKSDFIPA